MFGFGRKEGPLKKAGREAAEAGDAVEHAAYAAHGLIAELTGLVKDVRGGGAGVSMSIAKTDDGYGVIARYVPPKE